MSGLLLRRLLYGSLVLLFVLRHDVWWWDDPRRVLGLPIGLTFQIGLCLAASVVFGLLVRHAWPAELEVGPDA